MQFLIALCLSLFALSAQAQTYGPGQRATSGTLTRPNQVITGGGVTVQTVCAADPTLPLTATGCAGSFTVNCGNGPLQYLTNGGALTLTAPKDDSSCLILLTNNASAGVITFTGFTTKTPAGDALTTTNGNKFTLSVWRINSVSGYNVTAQQ